MLMFGPQTSAALMSTEGLWSKMSNRTNLKLMILENEITQKLRKNIKSRLI